MKTFLKKCPLLIGILITIIGTAGIYFLPLMSDENPYISGIARIIWAVIITLGVRYLLLVKHHKPEKGSFGVGFKMFLPMFIFLVILSAATVASAFIKGTASIDSTFWVNLVGTAVSCIGIGFVEEIIFRVALPDGIIKQFPDGKHTLVITMIVSGLIFGFVHVVTSLDVEMTATNIAQIIGKTLESGIFGVYMVMIYWRTKNIYTCVFAHAANDFLLFIGTLLTAGEGASSYVASDQSEGIAAVGIYAFLFVVQLIIVLVKKTQMTKEVMDGVRDWMKE